ncbi:MAG: 2OG-Fe(II) oxygenase [Cyanobacteria bacterium P01_D01_bin.1]
MCKRSLDNDGALVLRNFLQAGAIASIQAEGRNNQHLAHYTTKRHNIYLAPPDPNYPSDHPRNRTVATSKGCITTDQIPSNSALRTLYVAPLFREFLCAVLNEASLYEYADPLSSINLHYASEGQELGWHFDNSSFAVTLLIQRPKSGGVFEYVENVCNADNHETNSPTSKQPNYELANKVLDGKAVPKTLTMDAGTLVLFRGHNAIHRVTPVVGDRTRMLVVLAFNTEPGISLSESARLTFFGRLK